MILTAGYIQGMTPPSTIAIGTSKYDNWRYTVKPIVEGIYKLSLVDPMTRTAVYTAEQYKAQLVKWKEYLTVADRQSIDQTITDMINRENLVRSAVSSIAAGITKSGPVLINDNGVAIPRSAYEPVPTSAAMSVPFNLPGTTIKIGSFEIPQMALYSLGIAIGVPVLLGALGKKKKKR